jgi:hypothetical protein
MKQWACEITDKETNFKNYGKKSSGQLSPSPSPPPQAVCLEGPTHMKASHISFFLIFEIHLIFNEELRHRYEHKYKTKGKVT